MLTREILDSPIKTIDGKMSVDNDGSPITFRKALVSCCGIYQPQTQPGWQAKAGEEAIHAYDLGLKIHNAKESLDLSNEDVDFLRKVIKSNRVYVAFITAQLLKVLEEK